MGPASGLRGASSSDEIGNQPAPGGLLVAETINPHSLPAFKTFWVDPTHRAPIFPEVASALALIHGFTSAEIVYPHGCGDAEADRVEQTEYALVASA